MHGSGTKLTYEDYVRIPDDGRRHEIIDGVHYVSAAPAFYHQRVSARLLSELVIAIDRPGLGQVVAAPVDVQLSKHDIVQPDLVVILAANESIITPAKVVGSPNLLVEILSPSSIRHDRERKWRLYERAGVREFWIVDPDERRVEQFVLGDGGYRCVATCSEAITLGVLPSLTVDLTTVW